MAEAEHLFALKTNGQGVDSEGIGVFTPSQTPFLGELILMQGNNLEQEFCPYQTGSAKSLSQFLIQTLSVTHKCGKAKSTLSLNVLVSCTIDGFFIQSLKLVVPLQLLGYDLKGKYISNNEFHDN